MLLLSKLLLFLLIVKVIRVSVGALLLIVIMMVAVRDGTTWVRILDEVGRK